VDFPNYYSLQYKEHGDYCFIILRHICTRNCISSCADAANKFSCKLSKVYMIHAAFVPLKLVSVSDSVTLILDLRLPGVRLATQPEAEAEGLCAGTEWRCRLLPAAYLCCNLKSYFCPNDNEQYSCLGALQLSSPNLL
jgi:hypothetical protein